MEYHKIETLFKRDPDTKFRTLLEGQYARPEFEYLKDCRWRLTEKVDGTNIRVDVSPLGDGAVKFQGRTDNSQIPAALVQVLRDTFEPMRPLLADKFPDGGTLHGEGYGARIQKGGGNYRPDPGFILFDVMVGPWWLMHEGVADVAHALGLDTVPVVGEGCTLDYMVEVIKKGLWSRWSPAGSWIGDISGGSDNDFHAEGIVARPMVELQDRSGRRIITKLKRKDFLT